MMINYKDKIGEKYKKILFIHGWGFNIKIWEDFVSSFMSEKNCTFIDLYKYIGDSKGNLKLAAKEVLDEHEDVDLIISWSLGCYLAKEIEILNKTNAIKLIYISYSPRFVISDTWSFGFEKNTIKKLRNDLKKDIIKTLKNFYLLILGDFKSKKNMYKKIISNIELMSAVDPKNLSDGLNIIEESDYKNFCKSKEVCNLYIYGDNDSISPFGIRKYIENWEPVSVIKVIPNSSHIPFLTNPDDFYKIVKEFI
jgi:pimeloyl-[acyl-carrier protein] methyl ester esterase